MKNIIIPDAEELKKKKQRIKKQGKKNLHVLSDFDRTLTKAFVNNEKVPSAISSIRRNAYLGKDYAKKAYQLFDKYHPIEINPSIKLEEKKEKMKEWLSEHYKLLKEKGMNKEVIDKLDKIISFNFDPEY